MVSKEFNWFAISILVPTPSVEEIITGSLIFNFDKSKADPKLSIFLNLFSFVFSLMVFFDIIDMYLTNLSAIEMFTPLFW